MKIHNDKVTGTIKLSGKGIEQWFRGTTASLYKFLGIKR